MPDFTIDQFWKAHLPSKKPEVFNPIAGWESVVDPLPTYIEAPLTKSDAFGGSASEKIGPIILVSAAGAVGKSTLARQIASATGAVYIDLGKAEPVGGNTLSGGLLKSGLIREWQNNSGAVLIDGLDEARLRVTQDGFKAFMDDIAYLARDRDIPTVLFGRTGSIQEAWLLLAESVSLTVLEIEYYTPELACQFALAHLLRKKPDYPFRIAASQAIELLLESLRNDVGGDGDRFAGYAPVLMAVAERVAEENNANALIAKIKRGDQPVTLRNITTAILEREQTKLEPLAFEDEGLRKELYKPTEQLARLMARVYGLPTPPLPAMSANDSQIYANALETWVSDHPFLDGSYKPVSAVFDAVIAGEALCHPQAREVAGARELAKGAAANPFLAEFYFAAQADDYIHPEHVGLVYSSLRARLSLGDEASLSIEGSDAEDAIEQLGAEIEIMLRRAGSEKLRVITFGTEQIGIIRLGSHVEDVEIVAPHADVEIGGGREAVLVSPVAIQCERILIRAERLIVECPLDQETGAISLEALKADVTEVTSVPLMNGNVTLTVNWDGAEAYPWTNLRSEQTASQDPRTDEALRRFRKFVISFRSHSKGALKRYAAKIEHERMTKGTGRAVLNHMVATGVVTTDGDMYTLFADRLAEVTGASFVSLMGRKFTDASVKFVQQAIANPQ